MKISIPEFTLVLLIGASSSGKTTFGKKYFKPYEVVSSDECRKMIVDNDSDQSINNDAFDVLNLIVEKRLKNRKLTVVDATNIKEDSRKSLIDIAYRNHCSVCAIVLNLSDKILIARNSERNDRTLRISTIKNQVMLVKQSIKHLRKEKVKSIFVIDNIEDIESIEINREKLVCDKTELTGPFDIIGDVHGCFDELIELLNKLGYTITNNENEFNAIHNEGRKAIFLGDFVDRGPKIVETISLVKNMVEAGNALVINGNHENKLIRYLKGSNVEVINGLEESVSQLKKLDDTKVSNIEEFLNQIISHYVLDNGKLVVTHAGIKEKYIGRLSRKIREFCIYGDTTGKLDQYGLPERNDWTVDYRGRALVVYGHTPNAEVYKNNNTINIDTGCVIGGKLTCFRYPENIFVYQDAFKTYSISKKPLVEVNKREEYHLLDINDVYGKKVLKTTRLENIIINEENSKVALETMSRFAIDPRWLIYLPPTMSPAETSQLYDFLEHPKEAFWYYKKNGVNKLVCEEKHMGSRAVVIICKDKSVPKVKFGIDENVLGVCYTRTGRSFFNDKAMECELLERLSSVLAKSNFWNRFNTDWVCIDCELMPWSDKARGLIKDQYAPVGLSGNTSLSNAISLINSALKYDHIVKAVPINTSGENLDLNKLLEKFETKYSAINKYISSYENYCWEVKSIDDFKLAPFHILATEGMSYFDKNHIWHIENIEKYMTYSNDIFYKTQFIEVDLDNQQSIDSAIDWWIELTSKGGEGMVVKPFDFVACNEKNELIQPAVKCRGHEYLRIIYGPEYDFEDNLNRLRKRSVKKKRTLALKEFALGVESIKRFVQNEPLYRIHECVYGVLALESEVVDPRL